MTYTDPRAAVDSLAAAREPYLIGVRHHSPALAAVVPDLLDASGADVVCVELPAEFQPWLEHLADPETVAPVALAGTGEDGRLAFYPFADFSPELAAIRWARAAGAAVVCCDLPLADRGWTATATGPAPEPVSQAGRSPVSRSPTPSPPPVRAGRATTCGTGPSRSSHRGAPGSSTPCGARRRLGAARGHGRRPGDGPGPRGAHAQRDHRRRRGRPPRGRGHRRLPRPGAYAGGGGRRGDARERAGPGRRRGRRRSAAHRYGYDPGG